MFKVLSFIFLLVFSGSFSRAQSTQQNDSLILADIIKPMLNKALEAQETPDWPGLVTEVQGKYGDTYVDRSLTKAKIYYYFGKDWALFSKALVYYTETYESKDDPKLMNKNARMVLMYSQEADEWKKALGWSKHAVDKEPSNNEYKETFDALSMKVKGQVAGMH